MIVSVLNHKGGTGKTTTVINLGRALVLLNKKVLLIDLDAQANLTYSLGITSPSFTIGDVIFNQCTLKQALVHKEGMDILPSDANLYQYEESIIKNTYGFDLLKAVLKLHNYDFILIDCPPSQSNLNINALNASNKVVVPVLLDVLSLQGLHQILRTVKDVQEHLNPRLAIAGILGVLVDERIQLSKEVMTHLKSDFTLNVFDTYIRANVKAAEAPSHGSSVIAYAPQSKSAKDYMKFAGEFLKLMDN